MSEDDAEREHDPTPQRLEEARRKGDIVRSTELLTAAGYAGLLLAVVMTGRAGVEGIGTRAVALIGLQRTGEEPLIGAAMGGAMRLMLPVLPLFVLPALAVLAALAAQRAIVFAPDKLQPKLSRINPLKNAGQKFGRSGLAEFVKSLAKLLFVSGLLGWFILDRLPELTLAQYRDARLAFAGLMEDFVRFLTLILMMIGGIAALDWFWQRHDFLRRNRMTRQELLDEMKQSDGDPHVKGQRRRRAEAIATQRMLADVPKADVVIVNPTHYAVALRWDRGSGRAPVCVAKGVDEVAARIREAASLAGVPIRSDPPAARALHASVDLGQEILPEHFAAVAAAIRFAETMRAKARRRWQ
ncbi:flagellar biosynthetic protein FlhB [Defluviimonas denitrificans]|jgi:flagellar biosynthetic protein FlhB|uniref:Flagellar biosynthetic protein FlhB n=1 Tax=Albidovulum denitrificans TaxID=404881 RepID=A0A2S8S8S7_9RHOB|nr:flagellar type III secretion system protein FlhB [Defluviimonas denitrificans]PQV57108.1 flagellar biosynthetic protein FlhB [Defluviimonas denitrificans]